MSYSPAIAARGAEQIISTFSLESIGVEAMATIVDGLASTNWPSANMAIFLPFVVVEPITVTKLWWGNGAANAGHVDVALHDTNGNVLVSTGSTVPNVVNNLQIVDVTDTGLDRGRYYFGMVSDTSGATQTIQASSKTAGIYQAFGLLQQASVTLPLATNANPATFAKYTNAFCPLVGLLANRVLSP